MVAKVRTMPDSGPGHKLHVCKYQLLMDGLSLLMRFSINFRYIHDTKRLLKVRLVIMMLYCPTICISNHAQI